MLHELGHCIDFKIGKFMNSRYDSYSQKEAEGYYTRDPFALNEGECIEKQPKNQEIAELSLSERTADNIALSLLVHLCKQE